MTALGRGDELVARLRAGAGEDADAVVYDLLTEMFDGYPLENLRPLLRSDDSTLVRHGIWIVSELGEAGTPLLDDVAPLLGHPHRNVRFFAIDTIITTTGAGDGETLARAVALVEDPESAVRWKVREMLAGVTAEQLNAAAAALTGRLAELTRWLVGVTPEDTEAVVARLGDEDPVLRAFAAAAAVRLARDDPRALAHAAAMADEDLAKFAARHDQEQRRRRRR